MLMKKYNLFEALLFAVVGILLYIEVLSQTHIVLMLLVLFSVFFTIFIVLGKYKIINKIIKLAIVWIMVASVCFFKMPSVPLGFLTIGISVYGLITRLLE